MDQVTGQTHMDHAKTIFFFWIALIQLRDRKQSSKRDSQQYIRVRVQVSG